MFDVTLGVAAAITTAACVALAFILVVLLRSNNRKELCATNCRVKSVSANRTPSSRSNNPFDSVATRYDASFCETPVGRRLRRQTWDALEAVFVNHGESTSSFQQQEGVVLELSCGTGEDALWLASQHHVPVLATDVSPGMLAVARSKWERVGAAAFPNCPAPIFQRLDLEHWEEDDNNLVLDHQSLTGVFSNFGGLNNVNPQCVVRMANKLAHQLPPDAKVVLVVMGRFCLTETLYYLLVRGNVGRAFRRLRSNPTQGFCANVGHGNRHAVYFHSMRFVEEAFCANSRFRTVRRQAIGLTVPPSLWSKSASRKVPSRVLSLLDTIDRLLGGLWPFYCWGDHYLVVLERLPEACNDLSNGAKATMLCSRR